jgi:hypothetical protein
MLRVSSRGDWDAPPEPGSDSQVIETGVRQGWEGTMPLSEHEQRLLDQIEQALYKEDPKFASSVRSARPRGRTRIMLLGSIAGVLAGLAIVLIGLTRNILVMGVVGFVLIIGSCVAAVSALRGPKTGGSISIVGSPNSARSTRPSGLRTKMEDRMRRRFDDQ